MNEYCESPYLLQEFSVCLTLYRDAPKKYAAIIMRKRLHTSEVKELHGSLSAGGVHPRKDAAQSFAELEGLLLLTEDVIHDPVVYLF